MGGGAAMRAAAKVAGIGVFGGGGLRGIAPDHPVSSAIRRIASPVAGYGVAENVKAAAAAVDMMPVQKPCLDVDDWELAGGEEDLFMASGEASPRLVFGGAPSVEEAKEATCELKDALEKAYLSSPTTPRSGLSGLSKSDVLETKAYVTSETIVAPAATKHAIQAFRFLSESPAVQSVVASIASDPNVWNAVLLNPTLQDYLHSQKTATDKYEKSSTTDGDILSPRSPRSYGLSSGSAESMSGESNPIKGLTVFWQELKLTVIDMMNSLSDYFDTLFWGYSGNKVEHKAPADANGNTFSGFVDKALGPSLMGLAVMVIMLVVLKRA